MCCPFLLGKDSSNNHALMLNSPFFSHGIAMRSPIIKILFPVIIILNTGCASAINNIVNKIDQLSEQGSLSDIANNAVGKFTDDFIPPEYSPAKISVSYEEGKDALPYRVAVIPLVNNTNDVEAPSILREMFFMAITYHGYKSQPLNETEQLLKDHVGITLGKQASLVSPITIGKILNVEGLFYGELNEYNKITTGVYNKRIVSAKFRLISAATGKVLWEAENTAMRRETNIAGGGNIQEAIKNTAQSALLGAAKNLFLSPIGPVAQDVVTTISITLPSTHSSLREFYYLPAPLLLNLEAALAGDISGMAYVSPGDVLPKGMLLPKYTVILPATTLPKNFPKYGEYMLPKDIRVPRGLAVISGDIEIKEDAVFPESEKGGLLLPPGYLIPKTITNTIK